MQSETAKTRLLVLVLANLGLLLFGNTAVAQQSIEDNIRPAGQVCLAGQSCVGSTVGSASAAPAPAATPRAVATAAVEVAVEIVEAVAEVAAFDVDAGVDQQADDVGVAVFPGPRCPVQGGGRVGVAPVEVDPDV